MTERRPICLITGASAGIGAATAKMAAHTHDLLLVYRSDQAGADAVAETCRAAGAKAETVRCDVAVPADVAALFEALDTRFGRIDALVNNAGIVGQTARLTEMDDARLTHIFAVNVVGALMVARETVRRMEQQGDGGVVVNISSAAARLGSPNQYVDYAATKGAIDTFTTGLANEVGTSGIRVVGVRPGIIDTAIHGKGGDPDRVARLGGSVPIGRAGTAEEIAEAIVWLLSPSASYITGTTLDVSGGR
ncbi:MAG: SDR family oxidoreductase [Pseudomonadota bacterium]